MNKSSSVCVLSFTINQRQGSEMSEKAAISPTKNLLEIFDKIFLKIILLTNNSLLDYFNSEHLYEVRGFRCKKVNSNISQVCLFISNQIKTVKKMMSINIQTDNWFFLVGGDSQLFPLLFAKITGKPCYLILTGCTRCSLSNFLNSDKYIINMILYIYLFFIYFLTDYIIVYSKNMIKENNLQRFNNKIIIMDRHFVKIENFFPKTTLESRGNIIGFVGRLSYEKGIMELVNSVKQLKKTIPDIKLIIIGDGILLQNIIETIDNLRLEENIQTLGWLEHNSLVDYYNKFKLLIIPSSTEGLPNNMLEAMACKTPVLSVSVGSVPDIICNNVNGFLINNNDTMTIQNKIIEILNHNMLEAVSETAYQYVIDHHTYEIKVKEWLTKLGPILNPAT